MGLGSKIKVFRTEKGLTQAELAAAIDSTRQTIISWEKESTKPDAEELKLLAKCLNKDLTMFHVEDEKKDDLLDHPLVKSYVDQINQLNKLVEILERENAKLRGQ